MTGASIWDTILVGTMVLSVAMGSSSNTADRRIARTRDARGVEIAGAKRDRRLVVPCKSLPRTLAKSGGETEFRGLAGLASLLPICNTAT